MAATLELWATLNGKPVGDGPLFTTMSASIVLTELNQFENSTVVLPAADRRVALAIAPYTLIEIVQAGVGTIGFGYVLDPLQQITENDDDTFTFDLVPLTAELTWDTTLPGWAAQNTFSIVMDRLVTGANSTNNPTIGTWSSKFMDTVGGPTDTTTLFPADDLTWLDAIITFAQWQSSYVRLGTDANGAPTRVIEFGQFLSPPTQWLISATGADAETVVQNDSVRLIERIEQHPNDVTKLGNFCASKGGGSQSTLVTLERCWRMLFDPNYLVTPGNSRYFPEYDPVNYPFFDPVHDPTGVYQGAPPCLDGRRDYTICDKASYGLYGYRRAKFVQSSLTYQGTSPAAQELTARALYQLTVANFKRYAHPHKSLTVITEGRGRVAKAGDLIGIDYQRHSIDDDGTVVEANVQENLRVMKIVRIFNSTNAGEDVPQDQWTLSNAGRFDDDDNSNTSNTAKQFAAIQLNQGTSLSTFQVGPFAADMDAHNAIDIPVDIPKEVFRITKASLIVTFQGYRGLSGTDTNTSGTQIPITVPTAPITISIPHGNQSIDGTFDPTTGLATGTTDGFQTDLYAHVYGVNATGATTGTGNFPESGGKPAFGRAGNALDIPIYRGANASNAGLDKSTTATGLKANVKQAIKAAATLINGTIDQFTIPGVLLPIHSHPIFPAINVGKAPSAISVSINGQLLSSGVTATPSSARDGNGNFTTSFRIDDISPYVNLPGTTVTLHFNSVADPVNNPLGLGRIQVGGTWMCEIGGLASYVTVAS